MSAVVAEERGYASVAEPGQLCWIADHTAASSSGPLFVETSTALLRTISEGLDIRSALPRLSGIAKQMLPHDALSLQCSDRAGRRICETRSPAELPAHDWSTYAHETEHSIVPDLRHLRFRSAANVDSGVLDTLITAGYRSALIVRSTAQLGIVSVTFLSKRSDAFTGQSVPAAKHIASCVALAVAREPLVPGDRDRTEARHRAEPVDARTRALVDADKVLQGQRRMVGRSQAWQRVLTRTLRVASTETTVFLQGESGTGKEVVARFIHQASRRKDGPFIAINCAALPEQLLESELFGYERGAFTGAHLAKAGQVELASRGVLFLDEVSEMSLTAQAKFLRFLQEREFQRLGGTRVQKADVRVIAASNRDLRQAVERGTFREDLFYRLQVFEIQLPPLRERASDIPLLTEHFLSEFAGTTGGRPARVDDQARDALLAHSWPGNIRELRNVLESAAILSDDGIIERQHLSLYAKPAAVPSPNDIAGIERQMIDDALRRTDGNKAKSARLLGLTRTQLYGRMRRYGIAGA
jgi:DNA-binding NtrC family response regulator